MISKEDKILILGLSGGIDSVTLLDLFISVYKDIKIIAAHVNHMLRADESYNDELFVKELCKDKNVVLETIRINVKKVANDKKISIEETGRICRYKFFSELCDKYYTNKIAVAHNKNDNVETVLLRLTRGTGLDGLCGISSVKIYKKNIIIRPLIDTDRNQIESYCNLNKLNYHTDSSNFNLNYSRNRIRYTIIPELKKINPDLINVFARNIKILSEDNNCFNVLIEKYINNDFIDISEVSILDRVLQKRIIKKIAQRNNLFNISYCHIKSILNLIKLDSNKKISLPNNFYAYRSFDKIIFSKDVDDIKQNFCYELYLNKYVYIKEIDMTIVISLSDILNDNILCCRKDFLFRKIFFSDTTDKFLIRNYNQGDKIFIKGLGHKKIKKFLSEKKINKLELISVLTDEKNNVLWIIGKQIDILSNIKNGMKYFIYAFR
jgi:tRNA(Ile)-lysidine synthase